MTEILLRNFQMNKSYDRLWSPKKNYAHLWIQMSSLGPSQGLTSPCTDSPKTSESSSSGHGLIQWTGEGQDGKESANRTSWMTIHDNSMLMRPLCNGGHFNIGCNKTKASKKHVLRIVWHLRGVSAFFWGGRVHHCWGTFKYWFLYVYIY